FEARISPRAPSVIVGDPVRMRQVLYNLMSNAVKFTDEGAIKLSVDAKRIDDEQALIRFSILDTGCGISASDIEKLFVEFEQVDASLTRRHGGTGLGLAIARRLAQMMNGDVTVKSAPGKGSRFDFTMRAQVLDWAPAALVEARAAPASAIIAPREEAREDRRAKPAPQPALEAPRAVNSKLVAEAGSAAAPRPQTEPAQPVAEATAAESPRAEPARTEPAATIDFDLEFEDVTGLEPADVALEDVDASDAADAFDFEEVAPAARAEAASDSHADELLFARPSQDDPLAAAGEDGAPLFGASNGAAAARNEPDVEDVQLAEVPRIADMSICVVEDLELNRRVIGAALYKYAEDITFAEEGEEALELLEQRAYDVIFMDIHMPGLDGWEVTRRIRASSGPNARTPIIAVSASVQDLVRRQCVASGMDGFLAKPIDIRTLHETLDRMLREDKMQLSDLHPTTAA
ncbi:MAG: ATP-binding protein, partial [Maricaulaceae bacterium]